MVGDDVRHVYTSVVHDTLHFPLRLARFLATVVDMLVLATTETTVHMGVLARLLQGCRLGWRRVARHLRWYFVSWQRHALF